jgi:hypothetical protein
MGRRSNPHVSLPISTEAAFAIKYWRAMLCLLRYSETEFTCTLLLFAPLQSGIFTEFDASLQGAGLVWYSRSDGVSLWGDSGRSGLGCNGQQSSERIPEGRITALTWAITGCPATARISPQGYALAPGVPNQSRTLQGRIELRKDS